LRAQIIRRDTFDLAQGIHRRVVVKGSPEDAEVRSQRRTEEGRDANPAGAKGQ